MEPTLPGVGDEASDSGAETFLVTLARRPDAAVDRAALVERGKAQSEAFRSHLEAYVKETERESELVRMGEATAFGMVSVVTTKALAESIRQFPEVESVVEDTAPIATVR